MQIFEWPQIKDRAGVAAEISDLNKKMKIKQSMENWENSEIPNETMMNYINTGL